MVYLYGIATAALMASLIVSKEKTKQAAKSAVKMFTNIVPLLLITLSVVSIVLYFLPDHVIAAYLGTDDVLVGATLAAVIGTISLLPGFITFPLCGLLLEQGVSYTVLAAFTTSLMMVGLVTYPIEKKYFGAKLTIVRNVSALIIALIVSVVIGMIYGEVF